MTISTTTSRISYNGNGVTTIFAVPFRFFANTDLVVQLVTVSTGASSTLTLTTHYTVTGADDEDGGSLTMVTAPAVGQRLVIRRVIAATQEVDYVAGDPFPAETHERALDRLTMLAQQGEEVNARALVFPTGDTASGELPAVVSRANRLIGFDAAGDLVVSAPASGSAAELALSLAGTGGAGLVGTPDGGTVEDALEFLAARTYGDATFIATGGNDTVALQAFIDANRGRRLVVRGTCSFAGVTMVGSTYDDTKIHFEHARLIPAATVGTNNFQAVYAGLALQEVDSVQVTGLFDGNRTVQQQREQTIMIVVAGCTNLHLPDVSFVELRGDGVYVSQANLTADSTTTNGLYIGRFNAVNTADDGRNALSIIAGRNIHIDQFTSINVGGVVGGVRQPGGLDIEPNFSYQAVEDVAIGTAYIRGAGTANFGVYGVEAGAETYNVKRVTVGHLHSINTNAAATAGHAAILLARVETAKVSATVSVNSASNGTSFIVDAAKKVVGNITVAYGHIGASLGAGSWVRDSDIEIHVQAYASVGIRSTGVSKTRVNGSIRGATSASSTFAVQCRSLTRGITQDNVIYSVNVPFDGLNVRGYRNEPTDTVTFTSCKIKGCDVSGYSFSTGIDGMQAGIVWEDVSGYMDAAAQPSSGSWPVGHFVRRNNPAIDGNSMTIFGWHRVTTGTGHVAGTDWYVLRASTVSPAV